MPLSIIELTMAVLLSYAAKLSTIPNIAKHTKHKKIVIISLNGFVFMPLTPILKLSFTGIRDLISLNGLSSEIFIAFSSVGANDSIFPSSSMCDAVFTSALTFSSSDKYASSRSRYSLMRFTSSAVSLYPFGKRKSLPL
ncbi:unknown [Clostridium sp. CAG:349]|nr:unknown [Clostridium sp. CAG:349]